VSRLCVVPLTALLLPAARAPRCRYARFPPQRVQKLVEGELFTAGAASAMVAGHSGGAASGPGSGSGAKPPKPPPAGGDAVLRGVAFVLQSPFVRFLPATLPPIAFVCTFVVPACSSLVYGMPPCTRQVTCPKRQLGSHPACQGHPWALLLHREA
jgi:hypothetical protein